MNKITFNKLGKTICILILFLALAVPAFAAGFNWFEKVKIMRISDMNVARIDHTATLLKDGRVLIVGGHLGKKYGYMQIDKTEIYDPITKKFSLIGKIKQARSGHTATLLSNGQVLIIGGTNNNSPTLKSEIYDPKQNKFKLVGNLNYPRVNHNAVLLPNGKVLIAGGNSLSPIEIYDPAKEEFSVISKNSYSGNILIPLSHESIIIEKTLGIIGLYNFNKDEFLNDQDIKRTNYAATLLPSEKILISGGSQFPDSLSRESSIGIYNPKINSFKSISNMLKARSSHISLLIPNGNIIFIGGDGGDFFNINSITAEMYNPLTNKNYNLVSIFEPSFGYTVTLLNNTNTQILFTGGAKTKTQEAKSESYILNILK